MVSYLVAGCAALPRANSEPPFMVTFKATLGRFSSGLVMKQNLLKSSSSLSKSSIYSSEASTVLSLGTNTS